MFYAQYTLLGPINLGTVRVWPDSWAGDMLEATLEASRYLLHGFVSADSTEDSSKPLSEPMMMKLLVVDAELQLLAEQRLTDRRFSFVLRASKL